MIARSAEAGIGRLLRDLTPRVLGAVARRHADFAAAEDAVQEALLAATTQWPSRGVPGNPAGWLYRVAARRLTDRVRSDAARRRREESVVSDPPDFGGFELDGDLDPDDTLVLLFMCCHPALTPPSAIALTLRAVGGLGTGELAHAFLVPEATMAQRISRAKQSIRTSQIPFSLPSAEERVERLGSVLHVLYLIFNEGYVSASGPSLQRTDLAGEAIRLGRILHRLLPGDSEVAGLLALMLLTDARRAARTGLHGELIPLDEQDRSRWDPEQIAEGVTLVSEALSRGTVGPYQLQAAIAALHDEAARVDDTDWPQILALYTLLERMSDNPMVALSRAVAVAMVHGPEAGLGQIQTLEADPRLAGHYRLDAVRGHLFERAGDPDRAIACFRTAADRTKSIPERNYLLGKAARLTPPNASRVTGLDNP